MCYFCHAQLFETTHAENIKSPLVQHSCRNAKVVEASAMQVAALRPAAGLPCMHTCTSSRSAVAPTIEGGANIALAAPPLPDFPRLRALALFGRRLPEYVVGSVVAGIRKPDRS